MLAGVLWFNFWLFEFISRQKRHYPFLLKTAYSCTQFSKDIFWSAFNESILWTVTKGFASKQYFYPTLKFILFGDYSYAEVHKIYLTLDIKRLKENVPRCLHNNLVYMVGRYNVWRYQGVKYGEYKRLADNREELKKKLNS